MAEEQARDLLVPARPPEAARSQAKEVRKGENLTNQTRKLSTSQDQPLEAGAPSPNATALASSRCAGPIQLLESQRSQNAQVPSELLEHEGPALRKPRHLASSWSKRDTGGRRAGTEAPRKLLEQEGYQR